MFENTFKNVFCVDKLRLMSCHGNHIKQAAEEQKVREKDFCMYRREKHDL